MTIMLGSHKLRQQRLAHPRNDSEAVAAVGEGHRREPLFLSLRHDEVGGFAVATGHVAEDFYTTLRPTMGAAAMRLEAALIHVNKVLFATKLWQQAAQFT